MYAAAIKLAYRPEREANTNAILIPGGKFGVWLMGSLGFAVVLFRIVLSLIPPGESSNKWLFESKLVGGTVIAVLIGLILYWRGAREKSHGAAAFPQASSITRFASNTRVAHSSARSPGR